MKLSARVVRIGHENEVGKNHVVGGVQTWKIERGIV
jgi:hypothetical protein